MMTVGAFAEKHSLTVLSLPDGGREIENVYIGDLLSWVMGRAQPGSAWITIMSNINICAVAALADTACVILAEGVTLDGNVVTTAKDKGINILSTPLTAYETAKLLAGELG